MSSRKTLYKQSVLVTNGNKPLSEALCEELVETHHCQVAYVSTGAQLTELHLNRAVKVFDCNFTQRQRVEKLATYLNEQCDRINFIIHQVAPIENAAEEEEPFVSQSSGDILGFVNMLTGLVPAMLRNGGGRIVSIKNTFSGAKALHDTQSEYHDLVKSISRSSQVSPCAGDPESIHLSTIFCDQYDLTRVPTRSTPASTNLTFNLNLTERELAQRILRGVESDQRIVQVSARRNLLELCSNNLTQLAAIGLGKLQLRKAQKIPIKIQ
ncbi:uncharacterized protein LOC129717999 [Wyeomyia smithii]|uniref:uncharacterized protein LOC129717999 n=1 Tax=Wyeomyia smithii TaxID=174621 RepID=UPI002467CCA4|nr:uncharacterized protein LOC129717999 [Wyeomyia smithii]XP_055524346.1 uncharacterized protein LOC129717999 [Wyeomyia smithii]XP_055524347.1 uncharacterized protein LOC129717999 [Wyeomyia smithii]XP_055524348.1 uncharacterized protein LOC129717999 [Wyeomyia smithii]